MTFEEFDMAMMRPLYVYRMAHAMVSYTNSPWSTSPRNVSMHKSALTRQANAQKEIDKLILERAETIRTELES